MPVIKEKETSVNAKCTICTAAAKAGVKGKITGRTVAGSDVQTWAHEHAETYDHPVQLEIAYIVTHVEKEAMSICRLCGCTDDNACIEPALYGGGTCCWIEPDLCSACAREES